MCVCVCECVREGGKGRDVRGGRGGGDVLREHPGTLEVGKHADSYILYSVFCIFSTAPKEWLMLLERVTEHSAEFYKQNLQLFLCDTCL